MYTKIVCTAAIAVAVLLTTEGSLVLKMGMFIHHTCAALALAVCWAADKITR